MFTLLDRYIIRQVLGPLIMTLGVAAMLLLLERMLRLFDFVVNQGGPVEVVFRLLGSLVPHYLGLALPLGLFLGVLVAFRKLSMNSELDAIGASGVGLKRILRPLLMLTVALMAINVALVSYVQPFSRYAYFGLVFDLRSGALGASIKVGEFVNLSDNMVLRIEESRNNGAELIGVFLERTLKDGRRLTITADRGGFFSTSNRQHVILRLYNGRLVNLNEGHGKPRVLTFDVQDIRIELPTFEAFRDRGKEYLELTMPELWARLDEPSLDTTEYNQMRGNLHWRLTITLLFLFAPFLGCALGITNKRTGRSLGLVVGITLVIVFNELLEVGETMIAGGAAPYKSIWPMLFGMAVLSVWFFHIRANRVGGDPLLWLQGLWNMIKWPFRRLIASFERDYG
ncbi:MAG: LPS export ABC transporter permease LptF [Proteobacteria bacterium]|nr:LPS export ABC transporter permease LptF [Pseudomonadota bacterium]